MASTTALHTARSVRRSLFILHCCGKLHFFKHCFDEGVEKDPNGTMNSALLVHNGDCSVERGVICVASVVGREEAPIFSSMRLLSS